jgi:hypothetical protein
MLCISRINIPGRIFKRQRRKHCQEKRDSHKYIRLLLSNKAIFCEFSANIRSDSRIRPSVVPLLAEMFFVEYVRETAVGHLTAKQ